MTEKTGVILRDLFLDALEIYREDNEDFENEFYDLLGKSIKKAKEGFLDSPGLMGSDYYYENDPDGFEHFMAFSYAVEMCSLIPEASERSTKLLSKVTNKDMDSVVERYMEEASRCYIHGFFLAAAIMCRGAIEYSLKKHLEKDSNIIYFKIDDLLNEAIKRGSISVKQKNLIRKMYTDQSKIIHGKRQIDSDKCLEYLNFTKEIIGKLL